jgi:hypothetical protein
LSRSPHRRRETAAGARLRRLGARAANPRTRAGIVADHVLHRARRKRRVPVLAQDLVERVREIRDGVDQRPVEIEDEQKIGHRTRVVDLKFP